MGTWFKLVAGLLLVAAAVGLALSPFLEVWTVPGDDPLLSASILPTLAAGDVVILIRSASVGRGNLVRCPDPQAPGRYIIARAVGRAGDNLELSQEVVSLDGQRTPSPRACQPPEVAVYDPRVDENVTLSCAVEDYGDMPFEVLRSPGEAEKRVESTVETGRWFLVSDDRHVHLDSRDFGQIDPSPCERVVFRVVGAGGFGDRASRLSFIW
jgi:signal peptidase I